MKLLQFQRFLKKSKINFAFFLFSENSQDPSVPYFTKMKPSFAFLITTPRKADLYLTALDNPPKIKNITTKPLSKNWHKSYKGTRIGINKSSLTVAFLDALKKKFPKAKFIDIGKEMESLRVEKTSQELKNIAKACKVTTDALQALLKELPKRSLKTEKDVALFLEKQFYKNGCEIGFPTIVAMGKNASTPHHITNNTKLQRGFLLIDFGARYKNYNADCTRMLFLGQHTSNEHLFYNRLRDAQQEALDAVKEGVTYAALDQVARSSLGKYDKHFTHSLGHGIGIEVHESPQFGKEKIKKNVPFTIEPGIYFKGKVGIRIEDTVVWNKKLHILTNFTKELVSVKRF